jgi:hypothetical protein
VEKLFKGAEDLGGKQIEQRSHGDLARRSGTLEEEADVAGEVEKIIVSGL